LIDYHWPGNARELRNILERAAILCEGGLITAEHLSLQVAPRAVAPTLAEAAVVAAAARPAPPGDLSSMERAMIEQALQQARFNKSGCEDPRVDASAAVRSHAAVRTRLIADCRLLIASRRD